MSAIGMIATFRVLSPECPFCAFPEPSQTVRLGQIVPNRGNPRISGNAHERVIEGHKPLMTTLHPDPSFVMKRAERPLRRKRTCRNGDPKPTEIGSMRLNPRNSDNPPAGCGRKCRNVTYRPTWDVGCVLPLFRTQRANGTYGEHSGQNPIP